MDEQKEDYYGDDSSKKVGDFLLGFFGIWIVTYILFIIVASLSSVSIIASILYTPFSLILYIVLIVATLMIASSAGRRYIAIGFFASFLVPLLVFGACLILFSGFR